MRKAKIVGIKSVCVKPCIDIEVKSQEHIFYGNNVVVSNSHSISYAACSYWSAYQKAHNTKEFFLSYLYHAIEKQDPHQEIYELVSEAKLFDIQVATPSLKNFKDKFNITDEKIYFGLKDIKSLSGKTGDAVISSIQSIEVEHKKKITEFTWLEILMYLGTKINSTSFKALASVGFFRDFQGSISRTRALYEYEIFRTLTTAEQKWLSEEYNTMQWPNLLQALKSLAPTKKLGGGTNKKERQQAVENEIQLLLNPPYSLEDNNKWIIDQEVKFLGCPITLTKVETVDTSLANTTCKEIVNGKRGANICIVANIKTISEYTIKNGDSKGQKMAFLTIEDDTCMLDNVVAFPSVKEKYKYILYEGNNLVLCGNTKGKNDSLIIEKIMET